MSLLVCSSKAKINRQLKINNYEHIFHKNTNFQKQQKYRKSGDLNVNITS